MKKILLLSSAALLLLSACATQDDGDVLFSDTEKAIIKTLVYTDPADDPTSNYDLDSNAASLGQKFFWDKQFSGDIVVQGNRAVGFTPKTDLTSAKQVNCVSCHNPSFGWADNSSKPNDVSLGTNFTSRNSPTILNTAKNTYSLWDGASDTLWGVMRPAIEGNPHGFHRYGVAYVICTSNTLAKGNYLTFYTNIFGAPDCTNVTLPPCNSIAVANPAPCDSAATGRDSYGKTAYTAMTSVQQATIDKIFVNFGKAIAAYERQIVSKNSAFDQFANGNDSALTVSQKRGLKIFIGKGNCVRCHSGSNFSDGGFHNLGVPQVGGLSGSNDQGRSDGIATLKTGAGATFNTTTVYDDSGASTDRASTLSASSTTVGQFKTPTLRSVSETAPYFHNGTFASLWDVVNFYNFAGNAGNFPGTKDTILTTRHMTNEEMEDLVNFLKALDGEDLAASLTVTNIPSTQTAASWP